MTSQYLNEKEEMTLDRYPVSLVDYLLDINLTNIFTIFPSQQGNMEQTELMAETPKCSQPQISGTMETQFVIDIGN